MKNLFVFTFLLFFFCSKEKKMKKLNFFRVAKQMKKKTNLTDPDIVSPGPGHYKLREKWNDGIKFKFGERTNKEEPQRCSGSPGPAEYKIKDNQEGPFFS
jgi:Sperm-tail PG-rich repeat